MLREAYIISKNKFSSKYLSPLRGIFLRVNTQTFFSTQGGVAMACSFYNYCDIRGEYCNMDDQENFKWCGRHKNLSIFDDCSYYPGYHCTCPILRFITHGKCVLAENKGCCFLQKEAPKEFSIIAYEEEHQVYRERIDEYITEIGIGQIQKMAFEIINKYKARIPDVQPKPHNIKLVAA